MEVNEAQRQRIDDLLFAVTQQSNNGVHGLLDSVYGFLGRRTDFYYEAEPGDKMGFPPGMAESMVYSYFRKYQEQHQKRFPPKEETRKRWEEYEKQQKEKAETQKEEKKQPESVSQESKQVPVIDSFSVMNTQSVTKPVEKKKEEAKKPASNSMKEMEKISTYNGDSTEKYNWSQSINEVILQIPIPEGTTSKQMDIKLQTKKLFVKIKGQDTPLIDGELQERIKVEGSFWSIEDKKYVNVTFEKAYEAIWKAVIVGDKEIDTTKVDNSKRLEEFDLETQGHLQKVLYEQERKKRGLPTTEEEQQQKLMQSIMEKQGQMNPQLGLPYDPKKYGQNTMGSGAGAPIPFRQ